MDGMTIAQFVAGSVLLILGADALVRGASNIARTVGLSPLVIGLTVVAYGTSAPELAVSMHSARSGESAIAIGNVVGSNIFNVLLILGISALITPLTVAQRLVRLDTPLMLGVSLLLVLFCRDGRVNLLEGGVLAGGAAVYTIATLVVGRRDTAAPSNEHDSPNPGRSRLAPLFGSLLWVAVGLSGLVLGARWLVEAAVALARTIGVSELIIGLTIVAAGTSLPEVATSVIASIRGERDIAVGNVVGSNIFNILAVLGISALVAPTGIEAPPSLRNFDLPVLLATAVACLPIFFTGHRIARWEGALFLAYYMAYSAYLVLAATQHDALPAFSGVMWLFCLPLTFLTLAVLAFRARHQPQPN